MTPQIIGIICTALVIALASLCLIWHCRNFDVPGRDLFDAAREDWRRCVDAVAFVLCPAYGLLLAAHDALTGVAAAAGDDQSEAVTLEAA